jgi:hypothetical protein
MSYLRDLNLSDNLITYIEPNAFKYRPGSLASIQLVRNRVSKYKMYRSSALLFLLLQIRFHYLCILYLNRKSGLHI